MTFEEYLKSKKIASEAFKIKQPQYWNDFNRIFQEMHPKSFTAQKLFLINNLRRQFPLKTENKEKVVLTKSTGTTPAENEHKSSAQRVVPKMKPVLKKPAKPALKKPSKPVIKSEKDLTKKTAKPVIRRPKPE